MNKKLAGILLTIGLLISVLPVSGIIEYDTGFYWDMMHGNTSTLQIRKSSVIITGGRNNTPPIADAGGPYSGFTSDPITLDGSASIDPDGTIILFEWDFESDGTYDWSSPTTGITTHTYATSSIYTATLRVTDNESLNDTDMAVVTVTDPPNYPPDPPSNPQPINGAINVDFNQDLSWVGTDPNPGDVLVYDIYFGNISTPPLLATNHTVMVYDVGTMTYDETYYWQILVRDDEGLETLGSIWSFTVESETNHPPFIPSQPDPATGSSNNSLLSILSWVGGDPDGDNVTYDVYFGMNMTPALVSNNQTITTYDPGVLNDNTTYYWHIIAFDDENLSATGPLWEFTTRSNSPPGIPTTPYPSHNSSGVGINVDLSWFCGDPDGDPLSYDVYFGTTTNPPQIANNITTIPYDVGQLNVLITYYWYIVAWDPFGLSSTGPVWQFTTQSNTAPTRPVITHGPHAAGPGITINFSAIASDPEGDSIFYQWDWGDGNLSIWYGPYNLSDEPIMNYTWFFSGDYQVKVKAKDIKNAESPWSKTHNITIESQIFISNLDPGFVYFNVFIFNRSYMFIYALSVLGITAIISTAGFEAKATFSDAVDYVKFDAFNPVWGESIVVTDTNLSDGAQAYMSLTNGLWQMRAYAYDTDDIMIDEDMHYVLYLGAGQGGGQTIGARSHTLRDRLSNRLLK